MKLTKLSIEERRHSCLNCLCHYKAKGGIGMGLSSEHMCLKGRVIGITHHKNQNGHVRHLKEVQSTPKTCAEASNGRGYCKDLKRKDTSILLHGICSKYPLNIKAMMD